MAKMPVLLEVGSYLDKLLGTMGSVVSIPISAEMLREDQTPFEYQKDMVVSIPMVSPKALVKNPSESLQHDEIHMYSLVRLLKSDSLSEEPKCYFQGMNRNTTLLKM